jgi:SulP family sulfate permease
MTAIDATGLQSLEHFADVVHASGRGLILCGAPSQPAELMRQAEFEQHVGSQNLCANVGEALHRARTVFEEVRLTAPSPERWGGRTEDLASLN